MGQLNSGVLFDIQGFSIHDGPGCRTLIFLKGCSLNCPWCANPEGIHPFREPMWNTGKCVGDYYCLEACPGNAITLDQDNNLQFARTICRHCEHHPCITSCMTGALNLAGYILTVEEAFRRITRDRQYWGTDGGITLTGGEPFVQPDFTAALLKRCFDAYIHTAVETCGNVPFHNIAASLPYLDWIFYDLKYLVPNQIDELSANAGIVKKIRSNAEKLSQVFKGRLIFRLPLISGVNDSEENLSAIIEFILKTRVREINVLPGHHLGRGKFNLLGLKYYTSSYNTPDTEKLESVRQKFRSSGITCYTGSDTPF